MSPRDSSLSCLIQGEDEKIIGEECPGAEKGDPSRLVELLIRE
jgi:hypothetical protein